MYDREFLGYCLWKKLDEKTLLFVTKDTTMDAKPVYEGRVRGIYNLVMRISSQGSGLCSVEFLVDFDIGGSVSKALLNFYTAYQLKRVTVIQQYFQQLRGLETLDSTDAKALGLNLMLAIKNRGKWKSTEEAVAE